ncbi:MAG: hypothetical protein AB1420_01900 [Bacillota bacterium]
MVENKGERNLRFFADASTADGYISYLESVLEGLKKIYILKGGSAPAKAVLMQRIAGCLYQQGVYVEYIMCGLDHEKIDGLIIVPLKMAVVDISFPHRYESRYPGVVEEIINLEECWDKIFLEDHREEFIGNTNKSYEAMEKGHKYLNTAREIHDHWENLYTKGLDVKKANEKAQRVIEEIFATSPPKIRHLFASSINYQGPVNFIDEITSGCKKRFILKGQPGTGKATLLKKVVEEAIEKNYDVDIYHCALDPKKIDMVVIPQLKVCVVHGTIPHKIEPVRIGDIVIDMLECVEPKLAENVNQEARRLEEEFELTQDQAVRTFQEAKGYFNKLMELYTKATDHEEHKKREEKLENSIQEELHKQNNFNNNV